MGIGVAILLYGFAYVVLAALLSLIAWPIRTLLNHHPRLTSALWIAPLIIPGIPIVAGLGALVWVNFEPQRYVYRSVFDRLPDSTIVDLHGQSSGFNDDREAFLSFRDSGTAFRQALAAARFEPVEAPGSKDLIPMPGDFSTAMVDSQALRGSRRLRGTECPALGQNCHDSMPQRRDNLCPSPMDRLTCCPFRAVVSH